MKQQILPQLIQITKRGWLAIILAVFFAAMTVLLLWFLTPHEYSSEIQMLVVQKYTLTDSYTAAKSAEKISSNLAEVIRTSTFLDRVVETQAVDLTELINLEEAEKRQEWMDKIETEIISNTAMFKVMAYDVNKSQAEAIVKAIANVLVEYGGEYHGAPDTVSLKIVDTALTSNSIARPQLLVNGLAAALIGFLIGASITFFRSTTIFPIEKIKIPMPPKKSDLKNNHIHEAAEMIEHNLSSKKNNINLMPADEYRVLHVENFHEHLHRAQNSNQQELERLDDNTVRHLHGTASQEK